MVLIPRLLAVVLVVVGAAVSGCGSAEAPDPKPNLIKEYWESPQVENDRLPGYGASPGDRQANLAAYYSPDQLVSRLMSVFECTDASGATRGGNRFDTSCDLTPAVRRAVRDVGGDPGRVSGRVLLVKHEDGGLELVTLFIANGRAIDATGETYSGLDEFRAENDLLDADDVILAPSDLTRVEGDNQLVTAYGRTPWAGLPWLLGGGGVLVLVGLLLVLRKVRRSRS
ncbi:hypothetical protein ACIQMJ_34840 [Actinosynnema sp. NPDC091369]